VPRLRRLRDLSAVQAVFPELGIKKEEFCHRSGIGCSSRFPYYMNTLASNTIHGRAPAVATGSQGHFVPTWKSGWRPGTEMRFRLAAITPFHMLRRNVGIQVLLFKQQDLGLTKGQYSRLRNSTRRRNRRPLDR